MISFDWGHLLLELYSCIGCGDFVLGLDNEAVIINNNKLAVVATESAMATDHGTQSEGTHSFVPNCQRRLSLSWEHRTNARGNGRTMDMRVAPLATSGQSDASLAIITFISAIL